MPFHSPSSDGRQSGVDDDKKPEKTQTQKRLPQESIDHMWSRFSERRFQKVLSILPNSSMLQPAYGSPNELLSDSYNRAAEACQQSVEHIVQECIRSNTRFRDADWDLDRDLRWEKGNCLNTLGQQRFELNSEDEIPRSVKRAHEVFTKPTFLEEINSADVMQGSLDDCWFIAGLTALANVQVSLRRVCVAYNQMVGVYGFLFYRDGEWISTIIDDQLYLKSPMWDSPSLQRDLLEDIETDDIETTYHKTYHTGSKALFFARCKDQNETWVPLLEKAYAKAHGDYASLENGWISEGLEDLSGGIVAQFLSSDILDVGKFWSNELSKVNEEFLFGVTTGVGTGYGERNGITEGHAYVVLEARTLRSGERLVKLRNPWGVQEGIWKGAWSDGSKEWTKEAQDELDHTFGKDSAFWMSYEDLLNKFSCLDRIRLLRDPAWRCCQRWVGLDVPWRSQYRKTFRIKLVDNASPIIIVLSQLDRRYFIGLHGQYSFRLYFRLQDEHGANQYSIPAHYNHLMDRSVSIEFPHLPAGNYSVYLKVVGARDSTAKSTEDAVELECRKRSDNDKLARVGHAYDLVHNKAKDFLGIEEQLIQDSVLNSASGHRLLDDVDLEEEPMPDPWNAVCVIGLRVYSQDENLAIETILER